MINNYNGVKFLEGFVLRPTDKLNGTYPLPFLMMPHKLLSLYSEFTFLYKTYILSVNFHVLSDFLIG
jgi:hypothetical protein